MDHFDKRILAVLKNSEAVDFKQLLQESGFSHNTLRLHIAKLKSQGMVIQTEKTKKAPGRPILTYSLPPELKQEFTLATTHPPQAVFTLTFQELKHLCRFEKGGYCKETKRKCKAKNCPKTAEGE